MPVGRGSRPSSRQMLLPEGGHVPQVAAHGLGAEPAGTGALRSCRPVPRSWKIPAATHCSGHSCMSSDSHRSCQWPRCHRPDLFGGQSRS